MQQVLNRLLNLVEKQASTVKDFKMLKAGSVNYLVFLGQLANENIGQELYKLKIQEPGSFFASRPLKHLQIFQSADL